MGKNYGNFTELQIRRDRVISLSGNIDHVMLSAGSRIRMTAVHKLHAVQAVPEARISVSSRRSGGLTKEEAERARMSEAQVDQLLVERVQKGDKQAFDLLIGKYQHRIVSLVARYVSDQTEALDVAQEAFHQGLPGNRPLPR